MKKKKREPGGLRLARFLRLVNPGLLLGNRVSVKLWISDLRCHFVHGHMDESLLLLLLRKGRRREVLGGCVARDDDGIWIWKRVVRATGRMRFRREPKPMAFLFSSSTTAAVPILKPRLFEKK